MGSSELRALRRAAADHTLFAPIALDAALDRLGFVQADPIRAPARAQDLILNWSYRFEAYVSPARRKLGYYALPLLRENGDDARIVGWVNASRPDGASLDIRAGYVTRRPSGAAFRDAFDVEVSRLRGFLSREPAPP